MNGTNLQKVQNAVIWVALGIICLALFGGGFSLGRKVGMAKVLPPDLPPADTVFVRDTTTTTEGGSEPVVPAGFELVRAGTASLLKSSEELLALYRDSLNRRPALVNIHDTTFIMVPKSVYTFTDHKTYEVAVNGYDVRLLWHKSYQDKAYITQRVPEYRPFRWTLYPEAELFAGASNIIGAKIGIGADIGIGDGGRWRFVPEAGYGFIYTDGIMSRGFYGGVGIKYNIIQIK